MRSFYLFLRIGYQTKDTGFEGCAEKKIRARIFSWFVFVKLTKTVIIFFFVCEACVKIEDKIHKKQRIRADFSCLLYLLKGKDNKKILITV